MRRAKMERAEFKAARGPETERTGFTPIRGIDALWMMAIVLVGCVATIAWGERIGVNGGHGWDGMAYVVWAKAFWQRVVVEHLTDYHSQRVFPSAVVHYALRLVGTPPEPKAILIAFQWLNTVLLVGSAGLYALTGRALRWSRPAVWVGFVALFACFANARHALYYPALTDPTAFVLGMALVWAYVTDRVFVVALVGALGVVTWPALPPLAIVMLVFRRSHEALDEGTPPRALRHITAVAISLALAGAFVAVGLHYLAHPVPGVGDEKFAAWVRRDVLPLTVASLATWMTAAYFCLLADPRVWRLRGYAAASLKSGWLVGSGLALLVVGLRWWWVHAIGTRGPGPTGAQFLCEHTLAALRGPLWGPVHHVVYFGPLVLVAFVYWRRIARQAVAWGPAMLVGAAMLIAFAAGSNSRQWNHLFPLLVVLTIAATEELWTRATVIAFVGFAVAWSKLWLHIGYDVPLKWQEFPNQRYFMNTGPYASDLMYLLHLAACVVTGVVLIVLLRRARDASQ